MAKQSTPKPRLFFMSRRLKWFGITKYWEKPSAPQEYATQKLQSGFLTEDEVGALDPSQSETVRDDIRDLDLILLEPFFESNQKAKHYQNSYFQQQWLLLIGTFITSIIATFTVLISSDLPDVATNTQSLTSTQVVQLAGVFTAVVTFVTTIVTYLVQTHRPQYLWYLWRTAAEELRRHYYFYLVHLPPYHANGSIELLERNVAQIVTQQIPADQPKASPSKTQRKKHALETSRILAGLYRTKRLEAQLQYYESRIAEYRLNLNFVMLSGVMLVGLATLLSTINAVIGSPILVAFIALLPVVAALLVLIEKVYGWGRQIKLYEDTVKRLILDNTQLPVDVGGRKWTARQSQTLAEYVSTVESTLKSEMDQWGQSVLKDGGDTPRLSAQETLEWALAKSNLPEDRVKQIQDIFNTP